MDKKEIIELIRFTAGELGLGTPIDLSIEDAESILNDFNSYRIDATKEHPRSNDEQKKVGSGINLKELDKKIKYILDAETPESLAEWFKMDNERFNNQLKDKVAVSNDELLKMAKEKTAEIHEYDNWDHVKAGLDNYELSIDGVINTLLAEYSSLVNQEDAVKFAEWIGIEGWCKVTAHHTWLKINYEGANENLTTTELYQEYLKQNL